MRKKDNNQNGRRVIIALVMLLITAAALLASIGVRYGKLNTQVETNIAQITQTRALAELTDRRTIELKKDVEYIRETVTEINTRLKKEEGR